MCYHAEFSRSRPNGNSVYVDSSEELPFASRLYNNNNNNNHDDIYSAVIMTEVIARVHSVHLVNVEQRISGRRPSDQAT